MHLNNATNGIPSVLVVQEALDATDVKAEMFYEIFHASDINIHTNRLKTYIH